MSLTKDNVAKLPSGESRTSNTSSVPDNRVLN